MSRKCSKCGSAKLNVEPEKFDAENTDEDWWSDQPGTLVWQRAQCLDCKSKLKLFSKGSSDRTELVN